MSDVETLLTGTRTWAVVGCSPDPRRDSHRIAALLQREGFRVIPVNPAKHPDVNFELATHFAEWITSVEVQTMIRDFGQAEFGQSLFNPSSAAWEAANG